MRVLALLPFIVFTASAADVLMVADEFPAMQGLGRQLILTSEVVDQQHMPAALSGYKAVVVYIHKDIKAQAEHAFIEYAENGGRLVLLHHSISSGKRKNKDWLPWLGVELPDKPFEQGGYKWIDPADFEFFNKRGEKVEFKDSEVYLNHVLRGERTTLWWLRYKGLEQPTAGWRKRAGSGEVFYFMAGHKATDFDIPLFARAVSDAIEGRMKNSQ